MLVPLPALALTAGLLSWHSIMVQALSAEDIPSDTPISSLLSSAATHLSRGEASEALVYYDVAVSRDPSDYLTFFKRATAYLSLGRTSQASQDFDKVLSLKPGFEGAHVQLAKLRARSGDWETARSHFASANKGPESTEVVAVAEAEDAARQAEAAAVAANWDECVARADTAISVATRASSLRELRSRCRFERGDVEAGMSDLQQLVQLRPGDTTPHLVIAAAAGYALGDIPAAMNQARKCLHSDPDSKPCRKMLKQLKSLDKTMAKAEKSINGKMPMTGIRTLVGSGEDPGALSELREDMKQLMDDGMIRDNMPRVLYSRVVDLVCQGYFQMESKKAQSYCDEALELDPESLFGLLHRGKQQLEKELFEAAIETYRKAAEAHPDRKDVVKPLLQEAEIELRRSQTKDYYKVLGVSRDADERQIKLAYRKLTKQFHPDKMISEGISKEDAEKKMASVNEAYEVLSDPELRARFDRGDDPNSQGQGSPFQNPFGGGGGHPFMFQQGGNSHAQFNFKFGGGGGFPF